MGSFVVVHPTSIHRRTPETENFLELIGVRISSRKVFVPAVQCIRSGSAFPFSMKISSMFLEGYSHHSFSACAMNSGPLSTQMVEGRPRHWVQFCQLFYDPFTGNALGYGDVKGPPG